MSKYHMIFDRTFRTAVLIIAIILGMVFVWGGASVAFAATLKPFSKVDSGTLTLGDIFEGLDTDKANYVVGYAPAPGEELILKTHVLMRLAMNTNVSWRPQSSVDQITIRSAATIIPQDMIEAALGKELEKHNIAGTYKIDYTGSLPKMVLPHDQSPEIEVANMRYHARNKYFEAEIVSPSVAKPLVRATVMGKIETMIEIPVLRKTLRSGDKITASDLEWISVKEKDVADNIILDSKKIVGLTPRRIVHAQQAIRDSALEKPQVVVRGDTVTIVYDYGPMNLTAHGRALESGAKEDLIRVVNISSNKTIDAFIMDDGVVTVTP